MLTRLHKPDACASNDMLPNGVPDGQVPTLQVIIIERSPLLVNLSKIHQGASQPSVYVLHHSDPAFDSLQRLLEAVPSASKHEAHLSDFRRMQHGIAGVGCVVGQLALATRFHTRIAAGEDAPHWWSPRTPVLVILAGYAYDAGHERRRTIDRPADCPW